MPRIAVVQFEAHGCPLIRLKGYDIVLLPESVCPAPHVDAVTIMPRGGYIEIYEPGGVTITAPCGSVIEVMGVRMYVMCSIDPCSRCSSADAVFVASPWWSRPREALREARLLTHLLMTLSYRCDVPVFFANLSGAYGHRVYTGRSGVYYYRLGAPLALGGVGEGHISYRLG